MVLSCLSMCESGNIVNTISCRALMHFDQTYINDALWDSDECVTVWGHRSRSRWNNKCWNRLCMSGGIQYLTSRVELHFLVVLVC